MKKIDTQELIGHLAMIFANITWGVMAPVSKYVTSLDSVSAFAVTGFRIVGACILFWTVSLFIKHEHVDKKDKIRLLFASMLAVVFNQGSFVSGVSLTSPIDASVITTTLPVITMILAAVIIKEPITSKKIIGIVIGIIGALMLVANSGNGNTTKDSNIWGDLLCLTAQISFALYVVIFKDLVGKYSPVTIMKWMFFWATLIFGPILAKDMINVNYSELSSKAYFGLGHIVILGTFVAYFMIPIGQHRLRPTIVTMYNYVQPIVSATVSLIVGLSTFSVVKGIATFLIFMGVFIVTQSKSKADLDKEKQCEIAK